MHRLRDGYGTIHLRAKQCRSYYYAKLFNKVFPGRDDHNTRRNCDIHGRYNRVFRSIDRLELFRRRFGLRGSDKNFVLDRSELYYRYLCNNSRRKILRHEKFSGYGGVQLRVLREWKLQTFRQPAGLDRGSSLVARMRITCH